MAWGAVAVWAAMPEAAVHEDRDLLVPPGEIGFAGEREMPPPAAEAEKAEGGGEAEFGSLVTAAADRREDS